MLWGARVRHHSPQKILIEKDSGWLMGQEYISNDLCLFNFNKCGLDLSRIENRRFMYHPDGWLILGIENAVSSDKLLGSHAEEFGEILECVNDNLPSYDEFIRGWIGVGGAYKKGIIHFAPHIPDGHVELFDKAFSFVEVALKNGFTEKAVLRGFPGKWEQTISEMLGVEESLDKKIESAKQLSSKQPVKACEIKQHEL